MTTDQIRELCEREITAITERLKNENLSALYDGQLIAYRRILEALNTP